MSFKWENSKSFIQISSISLKFTHTYTHTKKENNVYLLIAKAAIKFNQCLVDALLHFGLLITANNVKYQPINA